MDLLRDHITLHHFYYKSPFSELLYTKIKESTINEHKNIFNIDNLHFLPNNILTRLFKELKKYIRMTINNI